ncbi:hypothetical protein GC105_05425 [Alkalibaculum sp. M08DMB]|uniref:Uncharacterized protein n=1 Tax=Alkalibaculum sporogenes TaxID=2655001 RepID=A0A6A7K7P1_9FIRM|nr:hypothetical protein [Alkalibaculum sporogenes]MPW25227.1 hypothetical protein [Alkalibaculum sporogenes]
MKKLMILYLAIFFIIILSSCSIPANDEIDNKAQVFTLDEKNRVVYLNFAIANMDQLDDYTDKKISASIALSILDKDVYTKFPKDVQEELENIRWNWNKGYIPASGIIAY